MQSLNAIRIGMKGLAGHKVRAALSMLGIIFGVASVVAVIAVSEGARSEVLKQLAALGANNIIVRQLDWRSKKAEVRERKKKTRLHSDGLTVREAGAVARSCAWIAGHAPLRKLHVAVRRGETPVSAEVIGTTGAFLKVMDFRLKQGRWINAADERAARRVCVIEEEIRDRVFKLDAPLGRMLVIDHEPYTVVGVLKSKEKTGEKFDVADIKRLNRRIYIPLSAALRRTTREPLGDEVSEVIFHCRAAKDVKPAARLIQRFYETAHRMERVPPKERDYAVYIAKDLLGRIEESQKIFNIVMLCSAGISLVVGGIGIMNIMLANVSERRREVGIRRAVGATRADILRQFLFESLIICLLGGFLGCLLGVLFTKGVAFYTGWQTDLAVWGMLVAVGVSLLDGVAFGTYPAWKAAALDPIDALRFE